MLLQRHPLMMTGQLEQAREHLSGLFWPHELAPVHSRQNLDFRHNKANLASLSVNALRYGEEVKINASPSSDSFLFKCTLDGFAELQQSGYHIRSNPGSICVMNPTDHVQVHLSENHNQVTLRVDGSRLHRFLEEELQCNVGSPLRFLPFARSLDDKSSMLGKLMLPLCRELDAQPGCGTPARLRSYVEDYLLGAILAELPHTYSRLYQDIAGRTVPQSVARVKDYIFANFQEDLGLRELALIAGCSIRSLQSAFAREMGITPTRYIRQIRLEHAHRLLQSKDSGHGVTEAALAAGFTHMGKFSRYYKQYFSQLPSQTLKQGQKDKTLDTNIFLN